MEKSAFATALGIDLKESTGYEVYINPELNHFKSFHDYAWSQEMMVRAYKTSLSEDFLNLSAYWRKSSEGFRIPEVMMFAISIYRMDAMRSSKAEVFSMIRERLVSEMNMSNMRKQEMESLLRTYEMELIAAPEAFDARRAFENLVTHDELDFKIGLHSLVTSTFISVYFAYELFIKRCWHLLGGISRDKTSWQTILQEVLNDDASYKLVWDCPEVNEARKARDALVHHDGYTRELNPVEYKPYYELSGQLILVRAESVKTLYENLRVRADTLCNIVLGRQ